MKFRTRILLSSLLILISYFVFYSTWMISQLTPRYIEVTEDNMYETALILSEIASLNLENNNPISNNIKRAFNQQDNKKIFAKINEITKTKLLLDAYITDEKGFILYDSGNENNIKKDFSKWNDVYLTLKGKYGARVSYDSGENEIIFVGAPIMLHGKIVGCLTVYKSIRAINPYIEIFKNKFMTIGVYALILFGIFSVLILAWVLIPLKKLVDYSRNLSEQFNINKSASKKDEFSSLRHDLHAISEELDDRLYIEKYLHVLSHELKGPISAIKGASEILDQNMEDPDLRKFSENISFEIQRIQDLILKFLEIASLEFRENSIPMQKLQLSKTINLSIEAVEQQAKSNQISIVTQINDSHFIMANELLLTEAFTNILRNSINFSLKNQSIEISSWVKNNNITITFRDFGSGIPEYALTKVFDKFYSLKSTNSNKKSTGLGLAFVKEVFKQHDAKISIENAKDKGVIVSITLPIMT